MSYGLVCLLAESAPHNWAKLEQQVGAATEFMLRPTGTAEEYAARLGMCRRQFFRLLNRLRMADADKLRAHPTQRRTKHSPTVIEHLDQVISYLGQDANPSNYLTEIEQRFSTAGLTLPSSTAALHRLSMARRHNLGPSSVVMPDIILDHCAMGVRVEAHGEDTHPAFLTAIVHGPSGSVLGHHVSLGEVRVEAYVAALCDGLARPGLPSQVVMISAAVQKAAGHRIMTLLRSAGIEADVFTTSKRTYAYSLSRNLTGSVGRIRLLPRYKSGTILPREVAGTGVRLSLLQQVVRMLLADWNLRRSGPYSIREILSHAAASNLEQQLIGRPRSPLAAAA